MLVTVVPPLIETPTSRRRFDAEPTVWFQARVVPAVDVKLLEGVSAVRSRATGGIGTARETGPTGGR
jgi:hypothetical protein